MSIPLRLWIPLSVTAATLIVCALGVHAELKTAASSIAKHRHQVQLAHPAASSIAAMRDEQALNPPPY